MKWRIWWIFSVVLLLYIGVISRLVYWQVFRGHSLRVKAASQYSFRNTVQPNRGEIYAKDGTALVINQPGYLVYAEPNHIENPLLFSRSVSDILGSSVEDIADKVNDPSKQWVLLDRRISQDKKTALEQAINEGIGFEPTVLRLYPEASMAAHLLGFVGFDDNGNPKGYFGLEGFYDRDLSGKTGVIHRDRSAAGNPMLLGDQEYIPAQDGRSLILWLDRTIQSIIERRLAEGISKYGALQGTVVVLDPNSGGVLGMASFPNYDPRNYQAFESEMYKNPAVAESYEPGSTFKPLVMALGIEHGVIEPETTFNEGGPVVVGPYSIKTWNNQYHGTISMTQVLQYSSNVGMVFVAKKLGDEAMIQGIQNFGFGVSTDIDLEDENSPSLRDESEWKEIDVATSSFGQGIAVSPLQITRAIATIANGGLLLEPQMVYGYKEQDGSIKTSPVKVVRRVFSEKTAAKARQMMIAAVEYGEAKWAKPKGYVVAGKTGTAQIPVSGHYDEEKTIASFVGFAPAHNPKFVMLVTLREPTTSPWGSETAAPLFFTIAKDLFAYMAIPPSE